MFARPIHWLSTLAGVFVGLLLLAASPQTSNQSRPDGPAAWAARAKARGETQIVVRAFNDELEGATFGEMVNCLSIMIAKPLKSTVVVGERKIETWYVFEVTEVVHRPEKKCPAFETSLEVPASLSVGPGQIAVPVVGGRANVDGVEIVEVSSESPGFKVGKEYLLFVHYVTESSAVIGVAGSGAYQISPDGKLRGTIKKPTRLKKRILALRTLGHVREEIKAAASRP